jgi:hypothetical protein
MKTLALAILMLAASAAYAQQNETAPPLAQTPPGPVLQIATDDTATHRLDVEIGAVRLTTHSGRYTFAYLPLLAPLPGTAFRSSMEMPNALALPARRFRNARVRNHRRSSASVDDFFVTVFDQAASQWT